MIDRSLRFPMLLSFYGGRMIVVILPLLLIPAVRVFFANPSDVTHVRH
jgi:hypothetical protein